MKKTFKLTHPKTKYPRMVDAVRSEVKRYIKRERKKAFPEGFDAWEFDCKFGATVEEAEVVSVEDIGKSISAAEAQELESFYIEILAKPSHRPERPVIPSHDDDFEAIDEEQVE